MKKITYYRCEFCEAEYGSEKEAKDCEASHVKPRRITAKVSYEEPCPVLAGNFRSNYPSEIEIEMEDGTEQIYITPYGK